MKIGSLTFLEKKPVGHPEPMLIRYILFRVPAIGIYLHKFVRSDYERALHDHPWPFLSILLGSYVEVHDQTIDGKEVQVLHKKWSVLLRPAEWRHRVIIDRPVWTILIVGRRCRKWGFHLASGWCWWRRYDPEKGICEDNVIDSQGSD